MGASHLTPLQNQEVRDDWVPKEAYTSREFLRLENERMWNRVWQIACRLEDIPNPGDYVTYDVANYSITVIRQTPERIRAYHNVCPHRGRLLTEGEGTLAKFFFCKYHGWRWNFDGSLAYVQDKDDWQDCAEFTDDNLKLQEVKVDTWAGYVFVNPAPDAEPLASFLDPVPQYLDPFEIQPWRYRWYKSVVLPCNWKTVLEAFNEAYHVATTHPQLLQHMGDDYTLSHAKGKHGMYVYPPRERCFGTPSPRTRKPMPADIRPGIIQHWTELNETLKAMYTERSFGAVTRLMELSADTPIPETFAKMVEFQKEAAVHGGAGWPDMDLQGMVDAGTNWHIFPNHVFLPLFDGSINYRARPYGDDPNICIFDIWSLVRYTPGTEPVIKKEFYPDWKENTVDNFGLILSQDFQNLEQVQKGMNSPAFKGARVNPRQESEISNMHRVLRRYLFD